MRPRLVTGAARGIRSQFSLMFSVSQSFCWKHPEKERNILKAVKKDKMRQMKEKFELRRFLHLIISEAPDFEAKGRLLTSNASVGGGRVLALEVGLSDPDQGGDVLQTVCDPRHDDTHVI